MIMWDILPHYILKLTVTTHSLLVGKALFDKTKDKGMNTVIKGRTKG